MSSEKLLNLRELRIALAGPRCPFRTPPAPATIRSWIPMGMKYHLLPGRSRKQFYLSEVLAFLREHTEVVE